MMSFRSTLARAALLLCAGSGFPLLLSAESSDSPDEERHHIQEELKRMQQRLLEMEQRLSEQQAVAATPAAPAGSASPNVFNPQISVILGGKYQHFSRSPGHFAVPGFLLGEAAGLDERGLALGESELNFSANVDNLFYGSLTVSLSPEGGAEVEEAYFQSLHMPFGLTLKAGRFFSGIGYLNQFHTHHDDFVDRPLPYRAFLDSQYGDEGVQIRWLAPTDTFLEFGAEVMRGDAFPSAGSAHQGAGAWDLSAHTGGDVGFSNSWKAGISWLHSTARQRDAFDGQGEPVGSYSGESQLWLADFVWKWAPNGNPVNRNFRFQSELFYRTEKGVLAGTAPAASYDGRHWGWYAEGVYRFHPRWKVGFRYSELRADNSGPAVVSGAILDDQGHIPRRASLVLGFSNSEFSRIRIQLAQDDSRRKRDYQFSMQYLMLLGAHGAHQF